MQMQSTTEARVLRKGEPLPEGLYDMHLGKVDPDWIWVSTQDDKVMGVLTTAPCHGIIIILRVKMDTAAPRTALRRLLRTCFADCKQRGYMGYMTWFSEDSEDERILMTIARNNGGMIIHKVGTAVASWFPQEGII
jgi:hypothetical protein